MHSTSLESRIEIVLTCSKQREDHRRHRWKVYAEIFTSHVSKRVVQLSRQTRTFLQIWESQELRFPSEIIESKAKEGSKQKVERQSKQVTEAVCVSSAYFVFISV